MKSRPRENRFIPLVFMAAVFAAPSAFAYKPADHRLITQQAIHLVNHCNPDLISNDLGDRIESANVNEDHNLLRKWWKYSHFYNPTKEVHFTYRKNGLVRVTQLEENLWKVLNSRDWEWTGPDPDPDSDDAEVPRRQTIAQASAKLAGYLLHHIQDLATPLHVVPVMHGLGDRFEGFHAQTSSLPVSCPISQRLEPGVIAAAYRAIGIDTLAALNERFEIERDDVPLVVDWHSFWTDGPGSSFGEYGFLGNHFGEKDFVQSRRHYAVPSEVMEQFHLQRWQKAVETSAAVLVSLFQNVTSRLDSTLR